MLFNFRYTFLTIILIVIRYVPIQFVDITDLTFMFSSAPISTPFIVLLAPDVIMIAYPEPVFYLSNYEAFSNHILTFATSEYNLNVIYP